MKLLPQPPNNRPNTSNLFSDEVLYNFLIGQHIKISLFRYVFPFTINDTNFGIRSIIVKGRCNCFGHSDNCNVNVLPYMCECNPETHTSGRLCEKCKILYNDKPFRIGTTNYTYPCKICQCHGHAFSCIYEKELDPFPEDYYRGSGGLCINCQNNTTGRFCETCTKGYYKNPFVPLNSHDICLQCICNPYGTIFNISNSNYVTCNEANGDCPCKKNVFGKMCNNCKFGFYNLSQDNPAGCIPFGYNVTNLTNQNKSHDFHFTISNLTQKNIENNSFRECKPLKSNNKSEDELTYQYLCVGSVKNNYDFIFNKTLMNFIYQIKEFCVCETNKNSQIKKHDIYSLCSCKAIKSDDCYQYKPQEFRFAERMAEDISYPDLFNDYVINIENNSITHTEFSMKSIYNLLYQSYNISKSDYVNNSTCIIVYWKFLNNSFSNIYHYDVWVKNNNYPSNFTKMNTTYPSLFHDNLLNQTEPTSYYSICDIETSSSYKIKIRIAKKTKTIFDSECENVNEKLCLLCHEKSKAQSLPSVNKWNSSGIIVQWSSQFQSLRPTTLYEISREPVSLNFPPPYLIPGIRFTGFSVAYINYKLMPNNVTFLGIQITIRTKQENTLILHANSIYNQSDFFTMYIQNGLLVCHLNMNDCSMQFTSDYKINEGMWHKIIVSIINNNFTISINEKYLTKNNYTTNCYNTYIIGRFYDIYIGGISKKTELNKKLKSSILFDQKFIGCMKNLEFLNNISTYWKIFNWDDLIMTSPFNSNPNGCPIDLVEGYHFIKNSHITNFESMPDHLSDFQLQFELSTKAESGILFFAFGKNETIFFLFQIKNSFLQAILSYNGSTIQTEQLCSKISSGKLYLLQLEKINTTISLKCNDFTKLFENFFLFEEVEFTPPFYIGGLPQSNHTIQNFKKYHHNIFVENFNGCIYNVSLISQYKFDILNSQENLFENIYMDGCPSNNYDLNASMKNLDKKIYNITNLVYLDSSETMYPSSEYLYQIKATNENEYCFSKYAIGISPPGIASSLDLPHNVQIINGYSVNILWKRPKINVGTIIQYVLIFIDTQNNSTQYVFETTNYENPILNKSVHNLIPNSKYKLYIKACTILYCYQNPMNLEIETPLELPKNIILPLANVTGTRFIYLTWAPPLNPTGQIISYILKRLDSVGIIYEGQDLAYNDSGLEPFNCYEYILSICNAIGCVSTDSKKFNTSQDAPLEIGSPVLTVLEKSKILVLWKEPKILNGLLKCYSIFYSTNISNINQHSTESLPNYINEYSLTNLNYGSLYYIAIQACTFGGCSVGEINENMTDEYIPDGISLPIITTISINSVNITWRPPSKPNGNIIYYEIIIDKIIILKKNSSENLFYILQNQILGIIHNISLIACNYNYCGSSFTTYFQLEDIPVGYVHLEINVNESDPRSLFLNWSQPQTTNGNITYQVICFGLFYRNTSLQNYLTYQDTKVLIKTHLVNKWIIINDLIPFSQYYIQINASNSKGYILSNIQIANMPYAGPDGLKPPILFSVNSTSILATWGKVGRNNAPDDILYQLLLREKENNSPFKRVFLTPTNLTTIQLGYLNSFTMYEFQVQAVNSYEIVHSKSSFIMTGEGIPQDFHQILIDEVLSNSIKFSWNKPINPNGIILNYNIILNDSYLKKLNGNILSYTLKNLEPFTIYEIKVESCNSISCISGNSSVTCRTLSSVPTEIDVPILTNLNSTNVLIKFSLPHKPNGPILKLSLQRSTNINNPTNGNFLEIYLSEVFSSNQSLVYIDKSILPYTLYFYRVKVYGLIDEGFSLWSTIKTKEAPPLGIYPPKLNINTPSSIKIQWQLPKYPNGILKCIIIEANNITFNISDAFHKQETFLNNLVPFTIYYVKISICNIAGCTNSNESTIFTPPSKPKGISLIKGIVFNTTTISLMWDPPLQLNGPDLLYILMRNILSQPLIEIWKYKENWTVLFIGNETSFDDFNLNILTTASYKLFIYNGVYIETSRKSLIKTTYGGVPMLPPFLYACKVTTSQIHIRWSLPKIKQLLGYPVLYKIFLLSEFTFINSDTILANGNYSYTLKNLTSNTRYSILLTLIINGGNNVLSNTIDVKTKSKALIKLSAPKVTIQSETEVVIYAEIPIQLRSLVQNYSVLIDKKIKIFTNANISRYYMIANLQPYSSYKFQIKLCLLLECLISNSTILATIEKPPLYMEKPRIIALTSNYMEIAWKLPKWPNGHIYKYNMEVIRICSSVSNENNNTELTKNECSMKEKMCGRKCYNDSDYICCNGSIFLYNNNYSCCDDKYLSNKFIYSAENYNESDYLCCDYKFYKKKMSYICCGKLYVYVPINKTCCLDHEAEKRHIALVNIDIGDACCGSIPYKLESKLQFCCNGKLRASFDMQCCGTDYINKTNLCFNNKLYIKKQKYNCCYQKYYNITLITGTDKSISISLLLQANQTEIYNKLCPTNLQMSSDLKEIAQFQCCKQLMSETQFKYCSNGTPYHNFSEFYYSSSYCSYIKNESICNLELNNMQNSFILEADSALYYRIKDLISNTKYQLKITAFNSAGSADSPPIYFQTQNGEFYIIKLNYLFVKSHSIFLFWIKPNIENILNYIIYRSNQDNETYEIYRGSENSYLDSYDIQPHHIYNYTLKMCTEVNCFVNEKISIITEERLPEDIFAPLIIDLSNFEVTIVWSAPSYPNGFICVYNIYLNSRYKIQYIEDIFQSTINNLLPFSKYEIILEACNSVGCINSSTLNFYTKEAPPKNLPNLVIFPLDTYSFYLEWFSPNQSNGIILGYRIYAAFNGQDGNDIINLIGLTDNETMTYIFMDITRTCKYIFIEVFNSVGSINSSEMVINFTSNCILMKIFNLQAIVNSAFYITVFWNVSTSNNHRFIVVVIGDDGFREFIDAGISDTLDINNLQPYTNYRISIMVCVNLQVNTCCGIIPIKILTKQYTPSQQNPPNLFVVNVNSIKISWNAPLLPNGLINYFNIKRFLPISNLITNVGTMINATNFTKTYTAYDNDSTLIADTVYQYCIIAYNNVGLITSDWASVKTAEKIPSNFNMNIINVYIFSVEIEWQKPLVTNGNISNYEINLILITYNDLLDHWMIYRIKSNSTYTIISGLEPFTDYKIRIGATNLAGTKYTKWKTFKTKLNSPKHFNNISVNNINNSFDIGFKIKWSEPDNNIEEVIKYEIELREVQNCFTWKIHSGNDWESIILGLKAFSKYEIIFTICNICGCSSKYGIYIKTKGFPVFIDTLNIDNISNNEVTIIWNSPIHSNGYKSIFQIWRITSITKSRKPRSINQMPNLIQTINNENFLFKNATFSYTDYNLSPFTRYSYYITFCNPVLCINSTPKDVVTMEYIPYKIGRINLVYSFELSKIYLSWEIPKFPNGIITEYKIFKNYNPINISFSNETFSYIDTNLSQSTTYNYALLACTLVGCSMGNYSSVETLPDAPEVVFPPYIIDKSPYHFVLSWNKTSSKYVNEYRLRFDNEFMYNGTKIKNIFIKHLTPYRNYSVCLIACTLGGCTESLNETIMTSETSPLNISSPNLYQNSTNFIIIKWEPPMYPNGKIISYSVIRNKTVIKKIDSQNVTMFMDALDITPGCIYEYAILAENNAGKLQSHYSFIYSLESFPSGLDVVKVLFKTSNFFIIKWTYPKQPNGVITEYKIIHKETTEKIMSFKPDTFQSTILFLKPFTIYMIYMQACTFIGCSSSKKQFARTLEDIPLGQMAPQLVTLQNPSGSNNGINITWGPPFQPNGNILRFRLARYESDQINNIVNIYEGLSLSYAETAYSVLSYTEYTYKVTSFNSLGNGASSRWITILTKEDKPKNVYKPLILNIHSRNLSGEIPNPIAERLNGLIIVFQLILNETAAFDLLETNFTIDMLQPFAFYSLYLNVCTSVGCSNSQSVIFMTNKDVEDPILNPNIEAITSNTLILNWSKPFKSNGIFICYLVEKLSFTNLTTLYKPIIEEISILNLFSYKEYKFRISIINDVGISSPSNWTTVITSVSNPYFLSDPIIYVKSSNPNRVVIDWSSSFMSNGPLLNYILQFNNNIDIDLMDTSYEILKSYADSLINFKINLITNISLISTPIYQFDWNLKTYIKYYVEKTSTDAIVFYYQRWFTIFIISLFFSTVVIIIVICLYCYCKKRHKYARERNPLYSGKMINSLSIIKWTKFHKSGNKILNLIEQNNFLNDQRDVSKNLEYSININHKFIDTDDKNSKKSNHLQNSIQNIISISDSYI